jgi:hypothetical protein
MLGAYTHTPGKIKNDEKGDVANDHYPGMAKMLHSGTFGATA